MLGTTVNAIAIVIGSLAGLAVKGGLSQRYQRILMQAVGLSVVLVGIKSAMSSDSLLFIIGCMVVGGLVGEGLQIERRLEWLGRFLEMRFGNTKGTLAKGFIAATLLFCVGSMAIVGSLESGISGNHETLFAKSILDGVTSLVLSSTLGVGVLFSSVSVFLYQGLITVMATLISPLLSDAVISHISAVGGLLILGIGITLLEIKTIKVGNLLPAVFMPLVYAVVMSVMIR